MNDNRRLIDLGERRIIEEFFRPRYGLQGGVPYYGDDSAYLADTGLLGNGTILATTDPCPEPMAAHLGYRSQYYRGWLLAAINLSDLAAAGARPLGLLTSYVLPNDMLVQDLSDLLDGVDACCRAVGTRVVGGNLKEGEKIDLSATAIGVCSPDRIVSRKGCASGDKIVVIGDLGNFWAGVLAKLKGLSIDQADEQVLMRNVLTPLPKVKVGYALAQEQLLSCCMDNSDGLYGSLTQLAAANGCEFRVDMSGVDVHPAVAGVSGRLGIDTMRLFLGWGDWQLIGCAPSHNMGTLRRVAAEHGVPVHEIGTVEEGQGVSLVHEGRRGQMAPLDSQRFTSDSWFSQGIDSYIKRVLNGPLWRS